MKNLIASLLLLTSFSAVSEDTNVESLDPEFMEFFAAIYEDPTDKVAAKLDGFAVKLNITPDQQSAWNAFKQLITNNMLLKRKRTEEFKNRFKARNGKRFTTLESIQLKIEMLNRQLQESREVLPIIEDLYVRLDATQKTLFDNGMRHLWFKKLKRKRR